MALRPEVVALENELLEVRRHLHKHPELSFEEVKTAAYVANYLRECGYEVTEQVGQTGVVGVLRGKQPHPCIAIRADMDALPIQETGDLEFRSVNAGVMHACGHDGHVAILLIAAKIIATQMAGKLQGTVKLLFQPAEEGKGGARAMLQDGCLENPHVDQVYGLHLWNYISNGFVGAMAGPIMAASDYFEIIIRGGGGHGAAPQGTQDCIVAACQLVSSLQTIISRNINPLESAVLTVGTINGGYNYNVIADEVKLTGTCRSYNPAIQQTIIDRMQALCDGLKLSFQLHACELNYMKGYPATVNDSPPHVELLKASAAKIVGNANVVEPERSMAAEDMSYFLQARPGCFFFLGSAPVPLEQEVFPHHKSNFTFNESALSIGASIWVQLIEDLLVNQQ